MLIVINKKAWAMAIVGHSYACGFGAFRIVNIGFNRDHVAKMYVDLVDVIIITVHTCAQA